MHPLRYTFQESNSCALLSGGRKVYPFLLAVSNNKITTTSKRSRAKPYLL